MGKRIVNFQLMDLWIVIFLLLVFFIVSSLIHSYPQLLSFFIQYQVVPTIFLLNCILGKMPFVHSIEPPPTSCAIWTSFYAYTVRVRLVTV